MRCKPSRSVAIVGCGVAEVLSRKAVTSYSKIRSSYLNGEYKTMQIENDIAQERYEKATFQSPSTDSEKTIQAIFVELMGVAAEQVGVSSGLMEMGVSSVEVIKFKKLLQEGFNIPDVPFITILTNPTIESLATAIEELSKPRPYDPVIVLNEEGTKLPLWLVHPGAGGILVCLNLAKQIIDRPLRQLNMVTAILTLALFLALIDDDDPDTFHPDIVRMTYDELWDEVLRRSPPGKLEEVGLDREKSMRWAEVSNSLHMIAWDYVPQGKLPGVDVWVAHPLKAVARNKEEWFSQQVIKWNDFSETPPHFYDAVGEHFTMINAENTPVFAKQLKAALHARGI